MTEPEGSMLVPCDEAAGVVTHSDGTVCGPGCQFPGHEVTPCR